MTQWLLDRSFRSSSGEVRWAALGEARPGAPPVVLLHGTPFSSYVWRGIATRPRRAPPGVRLGHAGVRRLGDAGRGRTSRSPRRPGSSANCWRTGTLTEPAVVAHDFGGCVALRAHLLHGAKLRAAGTRRPGGAGALGLAHLPAAGRAPRGLRAAAAGTAPGAGARVHLLRQPSGPAPGRPGPAGRRLVHGRGPAGVLPADRAERPAVHRRDRGPLRRARPADADLLGRAGQLDPGRQGTSSWPPPSRVRGCG